MNRDSEQNIDNLPLVALEAKLAGLYPERGAPVQNRGFVPLRMRSVPVYNVVADLP